jgi:hypothetical protein
LELDYELQNGTKIDRFADTLGENWTLKVHYGLL